MCHLTQLLPTSVLTRRCRLVRHQFQAKALTFPRPIFKSCAYMIDLYLDLSKLACKACKSWLRTGINKARPNQAELYWFQNRNRFWQFLMFLSAFKSETEKKQRTFCVCYKKHRSLPIGYVISLEVHKFGTRA